MQLVGMPHQDVTVPFFEQVIKQLSAYEALAEVQ